MDLRFLPFHFTEERVTAHFATQKVKKHESKRTCLRCCFT
ncbi:hypothetical protein HMPREF3207_01602 [Citrobacter koseri]|nr:hypothetical protein HMPREF3207_01602 [Citrobacter koseri]